MSPSGSGIDEAEVGVPYELHSRLVCQPYAVLAKVDQVHRQWAADHGLPEG